MRIFIIRHGDPNYEQDTVTEKGRREVELLSERLKNENISTIYCSPLGRARATAAPTCQKIGKAPIILDWLQEFPAPAIQTDYCEHPVCTWNLAPTFWSAYPDHFDRENWRHSPVFFNKTTGEQYDHVCKQFDDLIATHGFVRNGMLYDIKPGFEDSKETIAFFCHLGLGGCLLSHITGMPLPQWWHTMFLPTSSVTTVFMEKHQPHLPIAIGRIVGLGDTSHLYAGGEPISSSGLHNSMTS